MLKLDKMLGFLRCFMKKILSLLICLISISLMSSCDTNDHSNEILITDMSGAEVWVPKQPKKVAAVSPSTGDLMIAFGLGDILDGTYYSVMDNPWTEVIYPDSKNLFGYDYDNSVETFIERGVDLIFIPEPATAENLRNHGLNALCVRQFAEDGYGDYVFAFSEIVRSIWG
jgi:iron complex transport system substrate-binding protein